MREKREEPITKESETLRWNMVLCPPGILSYWWNGPIHHHCVHAIGNPSGLQARTELQHGDAVAQMQTVIQPPTIIYRCYQGHRPDNCDSMDN